MSSPPRLIYNRLMQPYPVSAIAERRAVVFHANGEHYLIGSDTVLRRYSSFPCSEINEYDLVLFYPGALVDTDCVLDNPIDIRGNLRLADRLHITGANIYGLSVSVESDYSLELERAAVYGLYAGCGVDNCQALVVMYNDSAIFGGYVYPSGGNGVVLAGSGLTFIGKVSGSGTGILSYSAQRSTINAKVDVDGEGIHIERGQDINIFAHVEATGSPLVVIDSTRINIYGLYHGGQPRLENYRGFLRATFTEHPQTSNATAAGELHIINATEFTWNGSFTGIVCLGPSFSCQRV